MTSTSKPHNIGAIERNALVDDVYEAIKTIVMDHVIYPGERIGIDALARELHVSPTPIREALARLEAERLVSKEPRKGYRTTELLSPQELEQLFEFRLTIEPVAAASAARHASAAQRQEILDEVSNKAVQPDGERYSDYRVLTDHDRRFHSLIFRAAGNTYALRAWESLHVHLHLFRLYFGTVHGQATLDEHAELVEAIVNSQPDAAYQLMRAHLMGSRGRFLDHFLPHQPIATSDPTELEI